MPRRARSPWIGRVIGGAVALAFLAALFFAIQSFLGKTDKPKKYVPQITLVKPPPPPPPPKEDRPPPPPPKREEVKVEQPKEAPAPAPGQPAGKDLGVDADGSGAGDGFGLVGKRGGTDLLATGGGGAAGAAASVNRAQFALFTNSAQQLLHDEIKRRLGEKTRNRDFRVNYKIWLAADGSIRRYELAPTGDAQVDAELDRALAEVRNLKLAPPSDLPQPLRFLFTSRATG
jgi:protein TonB